MKLFETINGAKMDNIDLIPKDAALVMKNNNYCSEFQNIPLICRIQLLKGINTRWRTAKKLVYRMKRPVFNRIQTKNQLISPRGGVVSKSLSKYPLKIPLTIAYIS